MTAALPPARRIGIAGTTLAHGGLVALALLAAHRSGARLPVVYEVNLVAAPPASTAKANPATPAPSAPAAVAPAIKRTSAKTPLKKTPVQPKATAPAAKNPVRPMPGVVPSTGQDVVTLHQEGIKFPFPEYLNKIANEVNQRWNQSGFRPGLHAEIAFLIMQDGSVPAASITVDKSSGNGTFDNNAMAAIEAAGAQRAFGPLPPGFNSASLPVLFNFTMMPKGGP